MSFPGEASTDPPGDPAPGRTGKSNRVWLGGIAAVVVLAAASVVAWLVIPGRSGDATAGPLITGEAVKQVLLDGDELTELLGQPFKATTASPIYGGLDEMGNPSTPGECAGVVNVAARSAYRSGDVQSYARQTWADATSGGTGYRRPDSKVMFVEEAVIALPSPAAAQALFTTFAEQWKRCDGQAINWEPGTGGAGAQSRFPASAIHITDVRVTDTVLAASVTLDKNPGAPDTRAVGVRGNCLIGVLIAFTGVENGTGSGDPETSSSDTVRAMMDKVSRLG